MTAAVVCMMTAAFYLWRRDLDTAFVIAALGVVSWFLNYRVKMSEITRAADLDERNKGEEDLHDEEQNDF